MENRRLQMQRDYYQLLLTIDSNVSKSPDACLSVILGLVVEITGADLGYVELRDANGKSWWSTHQCDVAEMKRIRKRISSGIIAETIESGETIVTSSAFLDPRFKDRKSVQTGKIDAVLCSPFRSGSTTGVIYLHKKDGDCINAADNIMQAELFTKYITPLLSCLKERIAEQGPYQFSGLIGRGKSFQQTLKEIMSIADLDVTVLLKGETGCGKTTLARIIHENSSRENNPFVHINCANLQENLAESELFGAVKGAHSTAYMDIKGKISSAAGGTLFLDEIGELPVSVQSKLLQFIEEGLYFPLGSSSPEKPDVRIITASNIDFKKAIENKTFRADLYYRISVFPITVPPLRERKEDIPELFQFFVDKYCSRFNVARLRAPKSTESALRKSFWPGNIRQMENTVQQAVLRAKSESSILLKVKHIFHNTNSNAIDGFSRVTTYREEKSAWEKKFISVQLQRHMWNISKTARTLGLSRAQMNNLVKTHNLRRKSA